MTVLHFQNGDKMLYSYETPVAAEINNGALLRTDKYFSRTTEGHIKKWVGEREAETVPHDRILEFIGGLKNV